MGKGEGRRKNREILLKRTALLILAFNLVAFALNGCGKPASGPSEKGSQAQEVSTSEIEMNPVLSIDHLIHGPKSYNNSYLISITIGAPMAEKCGISWDISEAQDGSLLAWLDGYDLYIGSSTGTIRLEGSAADMFREFNNAGTITWLPGTVDTSAVTDMSNMFYGCKELQELDLTGFDTGEVRNMNGMFRFCKKLKTLNLSSFVIREDATLEDMFGNCPEDLQVICEDQRVLDMLNSSQH